MKKMSLILVLCLLALFGGRAFSQQTQRASGIDPKADELLRKMSDLLAGAKTFSFRTDEVHEKIRRNGEKKEIRFTREVIVRRPDGLWQRAIGSGPNNLDFTFWYDGTTVVLQSNAMEMFAKTAAPGNIDDTMNYIGDRFDIPMPMGDVISYSIYDSTIGEGTTGNYVKVDDIEGVACHQLSFHAEVVDWTVWISQGEKPVLCRLQITYKSVEKEPKVLMTFRDWNFAPVISASTFTHVPVDGYSRIRIARYRAEEETADAAGTAEEEKQ